MSGSFAAILALITLLDQDLLLNFEISPGITALFYIGIFSTIFAASSSFIPEPHKNYDPQTLLEEILEELHYYPESFSNELHSIKTKIEFSNLFAMKIEIFLREFGSLLGVVYLLWVVIPPKLESILDFVDDVSVEVDGLGIVCSFALFDFHKHGISQVKKTNINV